MHFNPLGTRERDAMNRTLVTGAAGFVASHLIRELRKATPERRIVGVDTRPMVSTDLSAAFQMDICDPRMGSLMREERPDAVFHLAAACKEPGYPWREYFRINDLGTRSLLDAATAAQVSNIVFTSTMMVFAAGPRRNGEGDLCDPDTAYGSSKLLAERAVQAWCASDPGRSATILRPGVVFGQGDPGNVARMVRALAARRFAYVGRRDTIKSCIYVKDLITLLIDLASSGPGCRVLHVAYDDPTRISDIVSAATRAFGLRRKPLTVPIAAARALALPFSLLDPLGNRFAIHPRRIEKLYADTHIAPETLTRMQWKPRYSLEAAFRDWARDVSARIDQL